jgi:hypothetical protein
MIKHSFKYSICFNFECKFKCTFLLTNLDDIKIQNIEYVEMNKDNFGTHKGCQGIRNQNIVLFSISTF